MQLNELVKNISCIDRIGDMATEIGCLVTDSRDVVAGSLFFALEGLREDGHDFVLEAASRGASAAVVEKLCAVNIPQILVENCRVALPGIAAAFYGNPEKEMKFVTVVGTNGKTSVTHILRQIFDRAGKNCGVIGTNGCFFGKRYIPQNLTTPDPVDLYRTLRIMRNFDVDTVFMEESAHAIYHRKLSGIVAEVGIFTNCTEDHLDFFKDMATYAAVKKSYFVPSNCKKALVNCDDPTGREILTESGCELYSYGIEEPCDSFAVYIKNSLDGLRFVANLFDEVYDVSCRLYGRFNVYNLLACMTCAKLLGLSYDEIMDGVEGITEIDGRFNIVSCGARNIVIDFAHTPDGLKNVLKAARELTQGRLVCLFGCGGNRDRFKRKVMGEIGSELSDYLVVTSDNPRFEDPIDIMNDIREGIPPHKKFVMIENRRKAIEFAIGLLEPEDLLIICGKGSEKYQEIRGTKFVYTDYDCVREILDKLEES